MEDNGEYNQIAKYIVNNQIVNSHDDIRQKQRETGSGTFGCR